MAYSSTTKGKSQRKNVRRVMSARKEKFCIRSVFTAIIL